MKTLTARMTAGFALLLTLTTGLALLLGRWLIEREMRASLITLHTAEAREIGGDLPPDAARLPREQLAVALRDHLEGDSDLFLFQVHEAGGRVIFRSNNLGGALLPVLAAHGEPWIVDVPPHGRLLISEFARNGHHIQVASRLAPTEQVLQQYEEVGLGLIAGVALLSVALGRLFSRVMLRPIRAIEQTARHIGAANLGQRIPVPPGRDEIAELARLLNAMLDRLEASFRQVGQFSADASHELKTPLTLIRLQVERLRRQVADHPDASATVDGLLEDIARMQRLVENLLFLARAESGALQLSHETQDTGAFLADVAEDAAVLAEDRGLRFVLENTGAGRARFDPGLVRQVLFNLVSNAMAASPAGGRVTLRSALADGRWRVEVLDEGPGLPPEQLARLFERFVQLPRKEPAPAGGAGLGLAICRGIARQHGGEVTAENRGDRPGLRVRLELPADG